MEFTRLKELAWWNVYFAIKLALYGQGLLDFEVFGNLLLAIFLLIRIERVGLQRLRLGLALVAALFLVYLDAGRPAPDEAIQYLVSQLFHVAMTVMLIIGVYHYAQRYIEFSPLVFTAMLLVSLQQAGWLASAADLFPTDTANTAQLRASNTASGAEINDAILNRNLAEFFAVQRQKRVQYPLQNGADFDIVFVSICSLAWDDLIIAGLDQHPLLKQFDVYFDKFNSATSYSGPAVLRLLRADCGQAPHDSLFSDQGFRQCMNFANLTALGYSQALAMNHDGVFDGFLRQIHDHGGVGAALMDQSALRVAQKSFDGTPILDDGQVLNRWLKIRAKSGEGKQVLLYNTVSLHDGNRVVDAKTGMGVDSFRYRAATLLQQLQTFIGQLQDSGRNTLLILIPEHGAGLRGDKMQLPGMREIPAPSITHVPVAAKLIGANRLDERWHIAGHTSHLALSALIANIMKANAFGPSGYRAESIADGIPTTPPVAQNEGSTVMSFHGNSYISLDGRSWTLYPEAGFKR